MGAPKVCHETAEELAHAEHAADARRDAASLPDMTDAPMVKRHTERAKEAAGRRADHFTPGESAEEQRAAAIIAEAVPAKELLRICRAAVSLSYASRERVSSHDREEAAGKLLMWILGEREDPKPNRPLPAAAWSTDPKGAAVLLPAYMPPFAHLISQAKNLRRADDRKVSHTGGSLDALDAALEREMFSAGTLARDPADSVLSEAATGVAYALRACRGARRERHPRSCTCNIGTPVWLAVDAQRRADARYRAAEMLDALGLTGDLAAYCVAYREARSADLIALGDVKRAADGKERVPVAELVAAELGLSYATYRKTLTRGERVYSAHRTIERTVDAETGLTASAPDLIGHREALTLSTDDAGRALKPTASKRDSSSIGDRANGWRDHQPEQTTVRLSAKESASYSAPHWARLLKLSAPRSAGRLDAADKNRRKRAAARDAAETRALRTRVGLPA